MLRSALIQPLRAVSSSVRAFATASQKSEGKTWAILGAQWGDEGKGKLVDYMASDFDIVARCAGGSNAGHTVVVEGKRFAFHLLPSGMLSPKTTCVLGNGVVVHIPTLIKELDDLTSKGVDFTGRLKISDRAHIVFDFHQVVDGVQESGQKIGTTLRGIGPAYASKATRNGVRIGDLLQWDTFEPKVTGLYTSLQRQYNINHQLSNELRALKEQAERIKPLITDTVGYLYQSRQQGKSLLVEGANACLLDLDFGSYPYVTSSSTTIGGACTGLGIPPQVIGKTMGVAKAYLTRVGGGPFPTELNDKIGEGMRARGHEFGVTTGRPRRCGWFDAVAMRFSHMINGYSSLNITKLDVLSDLAEIKVAVAYKHKGKVLDAFPASLQTLEQVEVVYETFPGWGTDISHCRTFADLPAQAQSYLRRLQELVGVPISAVGVGPGREAMILMHAW